MYSFASRAVLLHTGCHKRTLEARREKNEKCSIRRIARTPSQIIEKHVSYTFFFQYTKVVLWMPQYNTLRFSGSAAQVILVYWLCNPCQFHQRHKQYGGSQNLTWASRLYDYRQLFLISLTDSVDIFHMNLISHKFKSIDGLISTMKPKRNLLGKEVTCLLAMVYANHH